MLLMIVYLNVSTNAFSFESLSEEKRTGFKGSRRLCGRRLIEVMKQTCAQGTTLPCFRAVDNSYSIVSNVKRFVPVNRRDDDYSTNYIRHHKNHHHKHKKARKQSLYRENFINDIIVAEKAPLNIFDDADQFKLHENEIANMRSKRSRVGLASKCCSVEGCNQEFIDQFCCSNEEREALNAAHNSK